MVHKQMKMAEIIHLNYHLLPIINRFGIQLGFGERTIAQICSEKNITVDFFVEVINVFLDDDYFPQEDLQKFSIENIMGFLKNTHDYFLNIKIKNIEKKIDALIEICCKDNSSKIELIRNFYLEYKNELVEHITYENEKIFPYIYQIISAHEQNKYIDTDDFKIQDYLDSHTNIEEKLYDLKNLIIKYLQLSDNFEISNEILFELFDLEKDLQNHQRFEEKVLVPIVVELEKIVTQKK